LVEWEEAQAGRNKRRSGAKRMRREKSGSWAP
jgi:hypothetical protein